MSRRRAVDADHPGYDPGSCGADGRAQCRRCLAPLAQPHAEFCGAACRHEHRIRASPAYARAAVFARDRGVCTHCRFDAGLVDRVIARIRRVEPDIEGDEPDPERVARAEATALWLIAALGFGVRRRSCSLWQMDHRVPFSDGGSDCGLGNYRTLCLACHAEQTRSMHARQAAQRRG